MLFFRGGFSCRFPSWVRILGTSMSWISRWLWVSVIAVIDGRCGLAKGKLERRLLSAISDELARSGVTRGEIQIRGDGRVRFSMEIPPETHQRLRNILTDG
jgi:hypothetical protein